MTLLVQTTPSKQSDKTATVEEAASRSLDLALDALKPPTLSPAAGFHLQTWHPVMGGRHKRKGSAQQKLSFAGRYQISTRPSWGLHVSLDPSLSRRCGLSYTIGKGSFSGAAFL